MFAQAKGIGSYWLGVSRVDGQWIQTNQDPVNWVNLNIEDVETPGTGDCLIADADNNFKIKRVDCADQYAV